MRYFDGTMR